MPIVDVTRTYLELRGPDALRHGRPLAHPLQLARVDAMGPVDYLALYSLVGGPWHWRDRLAWPAAQLAAYLADPHVHVWVARQDARIAGYFELTCSAHDDSAELVYFGLAPGFMGRGIGGWLLARAAAEAFALGAARVVLNTCTLDGPHALPNYLARGFRIVRDEVYAVELPG